MNYTRFLIVLLASAVMAFGEGENAAPAPVWSFIVTGDGRTDTKSAAPDPTGINRTVLKHVLHAIDAKKPQFVLFTGDLVSGTNDAIPSGIAEQFQTWKDLVRTETPGLNILPVRGNHETYGDPDGKLWLAAFKPWLDSNHVSYFPGEEGFSYVYWPPGHPEIAIIAVDQFINPHRISLGKLADALDLARARKVKHVFVCAHEMAFTCTSHPDADNMAAFPADRDHFIDLLQANGCEYFFAGHDHAYDWMAIKHKKWPANYVLNQIVAGTAGAPFYPDKTYYGDHHGYDLTRLDHRQNTYGFMNVAIDDKAITNSVTVTFEAVAP